MRLIVTFLLLAGAVANAAAQGPPGGGPGDPPGISLSLHRLSDLEFGTVTAGRERAIAPSDPDAAHFELRGLRMVHVLIQWDLPPTLAGIPLTFGPNSAAWAPTSSTGQQTLFDPNHDLRVRIPPSGAIFIWLGGLAQPSSQQTSGGFSENISLTITLELD